MELALLDPEHVPPVPEAHPALRRRRPATRAALQVRDGGMGMRKHLLTRYKQGKLTASSLTTICWHAVRGGHAGLDDLALHPEATNAADFLRRAIGVRAAETFYHGSVPMWDHEEQERQLFSLPFCLPHEEMSREFALDPSPFIVAEQTDPQLPPNFLAHPTVVEKGGLAFPVGYFSDAVPHTKSDSFIAFYWSNGLTGKRYLVTAVRKKDLCQCGCKGMCTLGTVYRIICWSFGALGAGTHPLTRHDGTPLDARRAGVAGQPLAGGYCGVLTEFRADLLEFVSACGFKNWKSNQRPCFLCMATREDWFNFPPSVAACRWELVDDAAYAAQVFRNYMYLN